MTAGATSEPMRAPSWRHWGLGLVRGSSQIFFQQNAVTGILILAAFFVADWRMGVLALLGALGGMVGGRLFGAGAADISTGMQSFCGTLVGAAVFSALGGSAWWSYLLAFVGGVATGLVTWFVRALLTSPVLKRFALPYTTAPFVIVATIIALSTLRWAVEPAATALPTDPVPAFAVSLLTNVSQVVLVDSAWPGALILVGLFAANWRVGVAAVLGSLIGSATAVLMGEPWSEIANGLAGYSGVLTAIALAVTFLRSGLASWLYALPWIVMTAVVTLVMHRLELDTYTWPYILTTWIALVVAFFVPRLERT